MFKSKIRRRRRKKGQYIGACVGEGHNATLQKMYVVIIISQSIKFRCIVVLQVAVLSFKKIYMLPYTKLLKRRTLVLDKNSIKSMSPETKLLPKMHYDALNILTPKTKDKMLFKHANRTHFGGTLCFGRYQVAPFQCGLQPTATIVECANHGKQLNISRNEFFMF